MLHLTNGQEKKKALEEVVQKLLWPQFFALTQDVTFQLCGSAGHAIKSAISWPRDVKLSKELLHPFFSVAKTTAFQRKITKRVTVALIAPGKTHRCVPSMSDGFSLKSSPSNNFHPSCICIPAIIYKLAKASSQATLCPCLCFEQTPTELLLLVASHFAALPLRQTAITVLSNSLHLKQECVGTVWRSS